MTVKFFYHTHMPDDMNERRAFCRVARLLYQAYGRATDTYFLIANIEPKDDHALTGLTQLDAMLFGPKFVAIIDFKSRFEPFDARDLQGEWISPNGYVLYGGGKVNPFQQAVRARQVWSEYLSRKSRDLFGHSRDRQFNASVQKIWRHLQSFVLVHPMLHPDCQLPTQELQANHNWFHLRSVDDVLELMFSNVSKRLVLTAVEAEQLIRYALFALEWEDMNEILHYPIGSLVIHEPNQPLVKEQLFSYDDLTIGRSHTQRYQVSSRTKQVSSYHARIEVHQGKVTLFDTGSLNGTYVHKKKLDSETGVELTPGLKIFLGGKGKNACQLWFEPVRLTTSPTEDRMTNDTYSRQSPNDGG